MSEINTGGPAFPVADPMGVHSPSNVAEAKRLAEGMTMRDYFAAKAMQAYLTAPDTGFDFEELSRAAYQQADAMLEARQA